MRKSAVNIWMVIGVLTSIGTATIIKVPQDQPTIQAGIDAAVDGDTVLVDTGRYMENINFNGKNLVLGSLFLVLEDTSYISQTVIDGNQNGSVVSFENGEDSSAILAGFTITNGYVVGGYGGGIFCGNNSNPMLRDLIVTNNGAGPGAAEDVPGFGGGIGCVESSPTFINVIVTENIARSAWGGEKGGGLYFYGSSSVLKNLIITNNVSDDDGGLIYSEMSTLVMENVLVRKNTTYYPQNFGNDISAIESKIVLNQTTVVSSYSAEEKYMTILLDHSVLFVTNSIIWNTLVQLQGIANAWETLLYVAYSDMKENSIAVTLDDCCTWEWLDGNISVEPLFMDADNGNFHLQETSPCVDAGTAFFVLEGDTLVNLPDSAYQGNAPDMGAFESPYSVAVNEETMLPTQFALIEPYPNPFNPTTTIEFSMPQSGIVSLTIYDILGRKVTVLVDSWQEAGRHSIQWNASNVPSGIYFVRMESGGFTRVRKAMVLK